MIKLYDSDNNLFFEIPESAVYKIEHFAQDIIVIMFNEYSYFFENLKNIINNCSYVIYNDTKTNDMSEWRYGVRISSNSNEIEYKLVIIFNI